MDFGEDGRQETREKLTDQLRDNRGSAQGAEVEMEVWRSGQ